MDGGAYLIKLQNPEKNMQNFPPIPFYLYKY